MFEVWDQELEANQAAFFPQPGSGYGPRPRICADCFSGRVAEEPVSSGYRSYCVDCGATLFSRTVGFPLRPGQIIARPKIMGPGSHWGTYLGEEQVFHNTPEHGAHLGTIDEFEAGLHIWPVAEPASGPEEVSEIISRAWRAEGTPYSLVDSNCQDTATEVRYGSPRSPTRDLVVLVIGGVVAYSIM